MTRATTISLLLLGALLAPASGAPAAGKTAEEFFSGRVTKWMARRITLEYDLTKPEALADFTHVNPFAAPGRGGFNVKDGAIRAHGTGAYVHVGVFEADVAVRLTLTSKDPHDMGVLLMEPGVTGRFILYGLADTFLSDLDNQPPRQHMITLHGAQTDGKPGSETVFRYFRRARKPELPADEPIEVEVLKRGTRNRFSFAGTYMDAEDKYDRLTEFQPAIYVVGSDMKVTKLEISGKLTEKWLTKKGIAFDPKEKDDEEVKEIEPPKGNLVPVPDDDPAPGRPGRGPGRWPGGGGSPAMQLVRKLGDTGAADKDREEAADGLTKENVKLDELRALVNLLKSDDLTTRTLAIRVLKKVTGKTLGYHPKAPEKAREKAVRSWFHFVMENRDKFR